MGARRVIRILAAAAIVAGAVVVTPPAAADEIVPVAGYPDLVALHEGDSGAAVIRLQYRLGELMFYHDPISGHYDRDTGYAVRAFHAYLGLEPSYDLAALDWIRLSSMPASPGIPDRRDESDRLEVDITRQLLFIVRDGEIAGILPVSTGGDYTYFSEDRNRNVPALTPRGNFTLLYHQYGWSCLPWCVYKYWGFTNVYGIHGYPSVPNRPVSHGCIRVTLWDAVWMEPLLHVGMPLHVWDSAPVIPPERPPHA
jgi:hypothetical protein